LGDDEDRSSGRTGVEGGRPAPVKIEVARIACAEREERDEEEVVRRFKLGSVTSTGLA
jgi:hypothetical protein